MVPKPLEQGFNEQIKFELESAYLYLSMAAFFDGQCLEGLARWTRSQA
jgi:ferritin